MERDELARSLHELQSLVTSLQSELDQFADADTTLQLDSRITELSEQLAHRDQVIHEKVLQLEQLEARTRAAEAAEETLREESEAVRTELQRQLKSLSARMSGYWIR